MKNENYIRFRELGNGHYQVNNLDFQLDQLTDFSQVLGLCDTIAEMAENQEGKVRDLEEKLQNSRNKLTGLQLLATKLAAKGDELEPVKRIYSTINSEVYLDLPREQTEALVQDNKWSYSPERVSVLHVSYGELFVEQAA